MRRIRYRRKLFTRAQLARLIGKRRAAAFWRRKAGRRRAKRRNPYYHGTTKKTAKRLTRSGFDLAHFGTGADKNFSKGKYLLGPGAGFFGKGVYLTTSLDLAKIYAQARKTGKGSVVAAEVNGSILDATQWESIAPAVRQWYIATVLKSRAVKGLPAWSAEKIGEYFNEAQAWTTERLQWIDRYARDNGFAGVKYGESEVVVFDAKNIGGIREVWSNPYWISPFRLEPYYVHHRGFQEGRGPFETIEEAEASWTPGDWYAIGANDGKNSRTPRPLPADQGKADKYMEGYLDGVQWRDTGKLPGENPPNFPETREEAIERLRSALEHSPRTTKPSPVAGWKVGNVTVCGTCAGRITDRGCSLDKSGSGIKPEPIWDGPVQCDIHTAQNPDKQSFKEYIAALKAKREAQIQAVLDAIGTSTIVRFDDEYGRQTWLSPAFAPDVAHDPRATHRLSYITETGLPSGHDVFHSKLDAVERLANTSWKVVEKNPRKKPFRYAPTRGLPPVPTDEELYSAASGILNYRAQGTQAIPPEGYTCEEPHCSEFDLAAIERMVQEGTMKFNPPRKSPNASFWWPRSRVQAKDYIRFHRTLLAGQKDKSLLRKMIEDVTPMVEYVIQNSKYRSYANRYSPQCPDCGDDMNWHGGDEVQPITSDLSAENTDYGYWQCDTCDKKVGWYDYLSKQVDDKGKWMYTDAEEALEKYLSMMDSEDFGTSHAGFESVMQFAHMSGPQANWFIEGGESTIDKVRLMGENP